MESGQKKLIQQQNQQILVDDLIQGKIHILEETIKKQNTRIQDEDLKDQANQVQLLEDEPASEQNIT